MPDWIDGRTKANYHVGDTVILRMADSTYHATITQVLDYSDDHSDGSACQQYYADVQFPHERVRDGLISQCMIQGFADASKG